MEETLIPVTNLPAELGKGFRVAWSLDLGSIIDQQRVGIDVMRLDGLLNVAGLGGIAIEGSGEWGDEPPTNAREARRAMRPYKVQLDSDFGGDDYYYDEGDDDEEHDDEFDDHYEYYDDDNSNERYNPLPRQLWHPNAIVTVNTNTLPTRVEQDRAAHSLTPEQAYAQQMDDMVRFGVVRAAYLALLSRPFHHHPYMFSFGATVLQTIDTLLGIPLVALQSWAFLASADRAQAALYNRGEHGSWSLQNYKKSLFPFGIQPDRFAVTALRAIPRRGLIRTLTS